MDGTSGHCLTLPFLHIGSGDEAFGFEACAPDLRTRFRGTRGSRSLASPRSDDHRRRIERRIFGDGTDALVGLHRPLAMIIGARTLARRRHDLEAADARTMSGRREIAARVVVLAETGRALDDDLPVAGTREAPVAVNHRAVDDHAVDRGGDARLARDDDHRAGLRARLPARKGGAERNGERQTAHALTDPGQQTSRLSLAKTPMVWG